MRMTFHRRSLIAAQPRPWLTRQAGECTFPVDGQGLGVRSCCNPCGSETYCRPHRRITYRRAPPVERLLETLLVLGIVE
jgi:hypothetical protein